MPLRDRFRCACLAALIATTLGCVQAPVQEMSDARQALAAAREVARDDLDRADIERAEQLLDDAEAALEAGRYSDARIDAGSAREMAIEVRERATQKRR